MKAPDILEFSIKVLLVMCCLPTTHIATRPPHIPTQWRLPNRLVVKIASNVSGAGIIGFVPRTKIISGEEY